MQHQDRVNLLELLDEPPFVKFSKRAKILNEVIKIFKKSALDNHYRGFSLDEFERVD